VFSDRIENPRVGGSNTPMHTAKTVFKHTVCVLSLKIGETTDFTTSILQSSF
jgi:hypothetical protein